ncbi:MAG: sn-glycerol-3-phosphate ABC transporter ATP-binding protein UgpC [Oscillospiraceae bacterium]|nr:sn-glycerol-3-phosphate ABC transporter ATP-binding protein UgpC [Oscillospiraceae bacterium]
MANVTLKNVVKTYPGDVTAVHDFSLEIEDKEFVILVGPSGCGKSTTLRMIAGLEEITAGELYIGGEQVTHVAPKDRNIAMVFQSYALFPHLTVYKNMGFGLKLRGESKEEIDRKVREAAGILGIEALLERKPKALSGGERQRVALGRAMVRNPSVFLLDEPLSNLDAKLRTSMRGEISKLHRRLETTFIYVTHDQIEAMTMGDRIVVMKDGYIQQVDTPQNLYAKPCNLFVAGFIGTPQMNFIDATVRETESGTYAEFGSITLPIPPGKAPADKEITLGIRPEDIYLAETHTGPGKIVQVDARVELAEHTGAEITVYATYHGVSLTATIPPRVEPQPGDMIRLAINCDKLHLFDKETGKVL